jgi:hypothetical protein
MAGDTVAPKAADDDDSATFSRPAKIIIGVIVFALGVLLALGSLRG